jgi:hypothetical protein
MSPESGPYGFPWGALFLVETPVLEHIIQAREFKSV